MRLLLLYAGCTTLREVGANVVSAGDKADYHQDQKAYQPETTAPEAAARVASPILNVVAQTIRCPNA